MERETTTYTCPQCRRQSRVLADEYGDHGCPCGWEPDYDEGGDDGRVENVIEKLRELEAKVDAERWPIVGDGNWREIADILDAYEPEGYEIDVVAEKFGGGGRWFTTEDITYKVTQSDGKVAYFSVNRERPATEMQEGGDFSYGIREVVPKEVTVIKYVAGRSA
ncbi:hypothetical protein PASE110613_09335 [Paenibacillus sediminis]|uniref:Uncharacterized protein n=1 Tax=Paenibacillus sediminis TaxID=664909 RepID=A0ABS4H6I2_9BACL|nr:hypothetical protein [Paenibacillus sediminis]MBP1938149.1 hypothetical protein [Paenibacillus sediminis]